MTRRPDHLDPARLTDRPTIAPRTDGRGAPWRTWSPRGLAAAALIVQLAALLAVTAIEPAPADAGVAWQWVGELLGAGYLVALACGGLLLDHPRESLRATSVAGGLGLVLAVGCPVSGHHELGLWWAGELGLFAAATVAPLIARRILRRR